jgi:hypothetical protein
MRSGNEGCRGGHESIRLGKPDTGDFDGLRAIEVNVIQPRDPEQDAEIRSLGESRRDLVRFDPKVLPPLLGRAFLARLQRDRVLPPETESESRQGDLAVMLSASA